MTSRDEFQRLRFRLDEALRENRRFRERIEVLASQNHHLRKRLRETVEHPPEATAFEEIESSMRPGGEPFLEPRPSRQSQRLEVYSASWFPLFKDGMVPLDPSPGLRSLTAVRVPIRMGFQLFNLDPDRIEEAVSKIEERQLRERDFIPVFVTDSSDFGVFRSRGYVFEYIPPSVANATTHERTENPILKDRLELITAKWDLRDIIDLAD